jgi:hypothetical protein
VTSGLYTSHWRNRDLVDLDATIIGISRGKPRRTAFLYRVMRELEPSNEVWNAPADDWRDLYGAQLEAIGAEAILARIADLSGGKPAVLLCWEPDGADCHRSLVAGYLEREAGVEVPELKPGDLPRRPDSPQVSLFDPDQHRREETT